MHATLFSRTAAVSCLLFTGALILAGCASKDNQPAPTPTGSAMGEDYGKGVAAHHAQLQGQAPPPTNGAAKP